MATSGLNVTEAVEELLAALLSPNVATLTVSLTAPSADELTATIKGIVAAEAPGAIGPGLVQVTVCAAAPHVQPAAEAETYENCAGKVSVTVMVPPVGPAVDPVALLPTVRSKVPLPPAVKVPLSVAVIPRSGTLIVVESLPFAEEVIPPPETPTWLT